MFDELDILDGAQTSDVLLQHQGSPLQNTLLLLHTHWFTNVNINQISRVYMQKDMKEITMSYNCTKGCTVKHTLGREHTLIETKRFKNKLNEFLCLDDDHWLPAFAIQEQLESLIRTIQTLKAQFHEKIVDKRLKYALNFDTNPNTFKIFRLANSYGFNQLTCEDVASINKILDKGRNPKSVQIRDLITNLMKEEKDRLNIKISQSFNLLKESEPKETPRSRNNNPVKEEQPPKRTARDNVRQKPEFRASKSNDLPIIKVNEIDNTQGHFNIALKVIKVKKEFALGQAQKRKIEFEGGDQTGLAIAVVDSLKMVKTGGVIMINNARVYSFHGTKQIQQHTKNSHLEQINQDIRVNQSYNFSQQARKRGNYRKEYSQKEGSTVNEKERERQREQRERERERQKVRQENRTTRSPTYRTQVSETTNNQERTRDEIRQQRGARDDINNRSYVSRREDRDRPTQYRNREEKDTEEKTVQYHRAQINKQLPPRRETQKQSEKSGYYSSDEAEEEQKPIKKEDKAELPKNAKKLTKIKDIEPDMNEELISLVAQVCEIRNDVRLANNCLFAIIGDETGTIWAELPKHNPVIRVNAVLHLKQLEVAIHQTQHKLMLKMAEDSTIEKTNMRMTKINLENDISEQAWVEQQDEEEEEEKEEKKEIVEDF